MLDTAIGISQGQPAHWKGLVLQASLINDGKELDVVLCAPRDAIDEVLLNSIVEVTIGHHKAYPASLQH